MSYWKKEMHSVVLLFFISLTWGCQEKMTTPVFTYQVDGYVQNLKSGRVTLEKLDLVSNERMEISTTTLADGRFSFSDTIQFWGLHSIVLNDSMRYPFFIESGNIEIQIPDFAKDSVVITGGINNELFTKHHFAFDKESGLDIITKHPNTVFAAFTSYYVIMNNDFLGDSVQNIVQLLLDDAKHSDYYSHIQKVAKSIERTTQGKSAPDFVVSDTLGSPIRLSDFRGKYVVLDFWTSWCVPCRKSNPEWKRIYEKFKDKNVTIFGVSFDVDCKKWKVALQKDNLPWTNGANCNGWDDISDLYGVKSVPQTFLIDPNGVILAKNFHAEDFEKKFSSYFKN